MTAGERITSSANPLVKRVRRLTADRRFREREGVFFVEGAQPTGRVLEMGWEVEVVLTSDELLGSSARKMVETLAASTRVVDLAPDIFARISERHGPGGVAAVVRDRAPEPSSLTRPSGIVLALLEPANPGNVGSILRTAEAAGASALILVGDSVDPYAPAVVKASMGSLFAIPVMRVPDLSSLIQVVRDLHRPLVAVTAGGTAEHWSTEYPDDAILLFGSERHGLPADVIAAAEVAVRIPMSGGLDSLNLAAAAAIVLYEAKRARNPQLPPSWGDGADASVRPHDRPRRVRAAI